MKRTTGVLLAGIVGLAVQASTGYALLLGPEFQVNSYTTSFQSVPTVATDAAGNFVVVWFSGVQDGSSYGVFGQRYDSSGAALGTEFQVNSYMTSNQYNAEVAVATGGSFVVVWNSYTQDGANTGIFGQRYDSAGNAAGTEFQVNSYTTNAQYAAGPGNDFVVAWGSYSQDGSNYGVFARLAADTTTTTSTTSTTTTSTTTLPPTTTTSTTTTSTTSTTSTTTSTTLPFTCGAAPEPDGSCNLADPSGADKSSVQITDDDSDPARDQFKWKWNKGVAVGIGDFADPDTSMNTYRVCIYDTTGLLRELDLPPGGIVATCGTQPCWKPSGTTGFKYKNNAGTPDGITGAKLKSGTAGRSQVQIKAKGP